MKLIIKKKTSITVHITCCTSVWFLWLHALAITKIFVFFFFFFFFEEDFKEEIKERKKVYDYSFGMTKHGKLKWTNR